MQPVLLKSKDIFFLSQEVFHQADFSLMRMKNILAAAYYNNSEGNWPIISEFKKKILCVKWLAEKKI